MKFLSVLHTLLVSAVIMAACNKSESDPPEPQPETPPAQKDTTLTSGLIAHYPFSGSAEDHSGNDFDLTIHGPVLTTDRFGQSGRAYHFNGSSDYMKIPKFSKADSLRNFTISLWIKGDLKTYHQKAISFFAPLRDNCITSLGLYSDSTGIYFNSIAVLEYGPNHCRSLLRDVPVPGAANQWIHVTLTQQLITPPGQQLYKYVFYVNGKALDNTAPYFNESPQYSDFSGGGIIGGYISSIAYEQIDQWFKGDIDDIRIYNRTLSEEEVLQLNLVKD